MLDKHMRGLLMNCFTKIVIIAKQIQEPLYKWFIDKIREVEERLKKRKINKQIIFFSDDLADLPEINSFDDDDTSIIIVDDMVLEKKGMKNVEEYFIRARKKYISLMFIAQSYFDIKSIIRKNCDYIILKKIASVRDLTRICSEYGMAGEKDKVIQLYKQSQKDENNFFMIDAKSTNPNLKYRINFEGVKMEDEEQ